MKKIVFLAFLLIPYLAMALLPSGKDKGKHYPAHFNTNITVDGNAREWPDSLFTRDVDSKIVYAVVNDSSNLYVCIMLYDDKQQMKFFREGMEVWFDPGGKKSKAACVHYPLNTTLNPAGRSGMRSSDPSAMKSIKLAFILQAKDLELSGFKEGIDGMYDNNSNRTGAKTKIRLDSTNVLVYESKIPLSLFKTDLLKSNPLSMGIIIHGIGYSTEKGTVKTSDRNQGGMNGQGGGHEGPGGQQGMQGHQDASQFGGGSPDSGNLQKMLEEVTIWHKFVIAR
jgi:hypothetical protein